MTSIPLGSAIKCASWGNYTAVGPLAAHEKRTIANCGVTMSLPEMDADTGNLPEGDHLATWTEFCERFSTDPRRRRHLRNLRIVLVDLVWPRGIPQVWVDGSFISITEYAEAARPRDIDVCYPVESGQDPLQWTAQRRDELKRRRKVDLISSRAVTNLFDRTPILDSFRRDEQGRPRGLVVLVNDRGEA